MAGSRRRGLPYDSRSRGQCTCSEKCKKESRVLGSTIRKDLAGLYSKVSQSFSSLYFITKKGKSCLKQVERGQVERGFDLLGSNRGLSGSIAWLFFVAQCARWAAANTLVL